MNKRNQKSQTTRSLNGSIAIASSPIAAIENLGLADVAVVTPQSLAQPSFDFDAADRLNPRDKFTGFPIGNRIRFADDADLDRPASGRAVSEDHPIAFARRLAAAPFRASAIESGPSLPARAYAQFLGLIQRLAKRLLRRNVHGRKLQLLEIQQLGEKRFVAIVRVGKQKFLIGGAATSVSLLAEIASRRTAVIAPRPFGQETA
jgi:hypothetical protein